MRDLDEWERCQNEYPCINACPLDDNIYEWHCNICPNSGEFKDVIIHLILYFDDKYPITNPSIKLCTTIKHRNIFDNYICLDMYRGWSAGYSITSILQQLESFLLNATFDRYYFQHSESFICDKCNHCYKNPFPITLSMNKNNDNNNNNNNYDDIKEREQEMDIPKCWFHRTAGLSGIGMLCLGYGIHPIYFTNGNNKTLTNQLFSSSKKNSHLIRSKIGNYSRIKSFLPIYDLLSSNAFLIHNIRKSMYNNRKFGYFLPLYINEKHGKIAMKLMDRFIIRMWNDANKFLLKQSKSQKLKKDFKFEKECHPWLKILTIAGMMDSLIISLMKYSKNKNGILSTHYCNQLLNAFFRLHHTLIGVYFYHENEISLLLQEQIKLFFEKDNTTGKYIYRNKENIPDFGIFMIYLTLWEQQQQQQQDNEEENKEQEKNLKQENKWSYIVMELLDELFTRETKNILDRNCNLINPKYCSNENRTTFTWTTNHESNNLFMYYCFFLNKCCKLGNFNITLDDQFEEYNENYGLPMNNKSFVWDLQEFSRKVSNEVMNFEDFFNIINVKYPGKKKMGNWLIKCMENSSYRNYHNNKKYISSLSLSSNGKINGKTQEEFSKSQIKERQMIKEAKKQLKSRQRRNNRAIKAQQARIAKKEEEKKQTETIPENDDNNDSNNNTKNSNETIVYKRTTKRTKWIKKCETAESKEVKETKEETINDDMTRSVAPSIPITEHSVLSSNDNGDNNEDEHNDECTVITDNEHTITEQQQELNISNIQSNNLKPIEHHKPILNSKSINKISNIHDNDNSGICISLSMLFSFEFFKIDSFGNKILINDICNDYDIIRLYFKPILNSNTIRAVSITFSNIYFDFGNISYPDSRIDGNNFNIIINNPINDKGFYGDFNKNNLFNRMNNNNNNNNNNINNSSNDILLSPRVKGTICNLMFELRHNEELKINFSNINMKYCNN